MELRHIRYFLAVADEGNFTRAARRIGIGQPPLSLQIRDLEREIGTPLFHRVPHGAELTAAGVAFQAVVRSLPLEVVRAVQSAQRAGRGEAGVLRVGFTGSAAMNPVVPATIRQFRRRHPDVELTLSESNSTGLAGALRDGRIDLAFLRPGAVEASDMHQMAFADEEMIVALASDHRALLAGQDASVVLGTLQDEVFVLTPREVGPTLFDAAVEACREAGFDARLGQAAPQIASVLSLVAAGQGVSIVPASMRQLALAGVDYRQISDVHPVARLSLMHARTNRSPLVRNFMLTARSGSAGG